MPPPKNRWSRPAAYARLDGSTRKRLLIEHMITLSVESMWVSEKLACEGICSICFMQEITGCEPDFEHDCLEADGI